MPEVITSRKHSANFIMQGQGKVKYTSECKNVKLTPKLFASADGLLFAE